MGVYDLSKMGKKWRDTIVRSIKVGGMSKRKGEVIKRGLW